MTRASLVLALLALFSSAARVHAAEAPPPDRTFESGWSAEGFVDPGYEAERSQIAFDDAGHAVSVWSGRALADDPFQVRWSTLSGTAWSASIQAFAPTTANERLPQLSRAPDGTIWAAWLRDDNHLGSGAFHGPSLMAARLSGGAWSLPETVEVETPALNEKALEVTFTILAVDHDEAWIAYAISPDGDPLSGERDLVTRRHTAAGWGPQVMLSNNALTETAPVLVLSTTGVPTALFRFANAASLLRAVRWTGSAWSDTPDDLTSPLIYGFDAAPDTSGAVRLIVDLREDPGTGVEYHMREFVLDDTGFHPGELLASAPVVVGGENDPPDWAGVSLSPGRPCPLCASVPNELVFRAMWVDFSQGGAPKVLTSLRTAAGFQPYEQAGTSYETTLAFPRAVHDVAIDRWYATWTAPPSFGGRKRSKFAFTQDFAGDIAVGGTFVAPDTVVVSVVCSGDASGRTFRLYRLDWPAGQGSPPFSPPVPAAAVALPGNPFSGPCPFTIHDRPGPGRWYYYLELEAQGTFPARSARSFNAAVVPQGGGGGTPGATSRLLFPRPQPAIGTVNLPFDLAVGGIPRILVRDLRGRLVRTFDFGVLPAGAYRDANAATWDGKDDAGRAVRGGVYFATLTVNGEAVGAPTRVVYFP